MAFVHGRHTEVLVAAADLSSYFRSHDIGVDVDTADSTTFTKAWKTHVVGAASAVLTLDGLYDPAMTDARDDLTVEAGTIVTVGPAGLSAVGQQARLLGVHSTAYAESSPVGDVVAFSWSVMADDAIGFGHVLHPLAEVTSDGDGATFDGLASSAAGAVAHLHVTAVSATDEIDVIVEDSANGSDWDPITGGAFATADAATSERLLIPGAIRRYLRASWDITGSGDNEVTFAVAMARL
jgi:hypothetical protein